MFDEFFLFYEICRFQAVNEMNDGMYVTDALVDWNINIGLLNSIPIPNLISQPRVSFHPWRRSINQPILPPHREYSHIHSALKEPRSRYAQLSVSILGYPRGNQCIYDTFQSTIGALGPRLPATRSPYHSFVALKPGWLPLSIRGPCRAPCATTE